MDYKYIHNGTINIYVLFISGNHVIENDFRSSDRVKEVNAIFKQPKNQGKTQYIFYHVNGTKVGERQEDMNCYTRKNIKLTLYGF